MKDINDIQFEIPKLNNPELPDFSNIFRQSQKMEKELMAGVEEANKEREKYKQDVLNTLKNIEKNTESLNEIILLMQNSNLQQEEMNVMIQEILNIAKAKTVEEAKGLFSKAIDKIKGLTDDVSAMYAIMNFGMTVTNIVIANLNK